MDFSTIETTSKKVRGNHVDFSTSEITSEKVRGNHVDFSTSEITSKKYAEMTRKTVEICSSTYRRNIHVESAWIRRGVPVGKELIGSLQNYNYNIYKARFLRTFFMLPIVSTRTLKL